MGTTGEPLTVEGVHIVRSGRGPIPTWYIYAWRGGPQVDKVKQPKKPKLTKEHLSKIAELTTIDRTQPTDTIAGAIWNYRQHDAWKTLGDGTRKTWGGHLDLIEAKWGKVPTRLFSDPRMTPKVVKWRDSRSATPRSADIGVMVLSHFLGWARLQGLVTINAAEKIPTIYRRRDRAEVIWLPQDIAAIEAVAGQPVIDALRLAMLTGFRRADLVALRWDEIGDFAITRRASKRSRGKRYMARAPVTPQLRKLLDDLRTRYRRVGVETVLVNSHGKKWSGDGLNSSFDDAREKANGKTGIWHVERDPDTGEEDRVAKRIHDFRGTFATILLTLPGKRLTDEEVADLMAWDAKNVAEIRKRYVDDAAVVVALGRRIARATAVKHRVKHTTK
ncbi:MAG: tyrosine-type recombinase/integrase [Sphingomonadales bacterium]|nr:tyrosine-type recombinase/integrase [Sphingomonadales bacterium]